MKAHSSVGTSRLFKFLPINFIVIVNALLVLFSCLLYRKLIGDGGVNLNELLKGTTNATTTTWSNAPFMHFQWDILLCEVGFIVPLLLLLETSNGNTGTGRNPALWLIRFLLCKLMLMSGIVKIQSGCPTWSRDMTGVHYNACWVRQLFIDYNFLRRLISSLNVYCYSAVLPFCNTAIANTRELLLSFFPKDRTSVWSDLYVSSYLYITLISVSLMNERVLKQWSWMFRPVAFI